MVSPIPQASPKALGADASAEAPEVQASQAAPRLSEPQQNPPQQPLSAEQREFVERLQRLYKADHQAEYLYIQAEVDSLFIQLEQAKAQQQATPSSVTTP